MSTYRRDLYQARVLVSTGQTEKAKALITKLAPFLLPCELNRLLYRITLVQNTDLLRFCFKIYPHPHLLPTRITEKMNLLRLAVEFSSDEVVQILLETKLFDVNLRHESDLETILGLAFQQDHYIKMKLLLREGAKLYPENRYTQIIQSNEIPESTCSLLITQIARERAEDRLTNPADVRILRNVYPAFYKEYRTATCEWLQLKHTIFFKNLSLRDLLEKTTSTLLRISRSKAFKTEAAKFEGYKFPVYGTEIQYVLEKLEEKVTDWETQEKRLREITFGYVPSTVIEQISFLLTLN